MVCRGMSVLKIPHHHYRLVCTPRKQATNTKTEYHRHLRVANPKGIEDSALEAVATTHNKSISHIEHPQNGPTG